MLRAERTREEKRLQLQNFEFYSPCFLDNRWYGNTMLNVCQAIVLDDFIKTKRRTECRNLLNKMQNELCIATKQFIVCMREP